MKTLISAIDPQHVRERMGRRKEARQGRDAGFSMLETLLAMAVVAIIALAISPQAEKFLERAAVHNLTSEIASAQLLVEADNSLSGEAKYDLTTIQASVEQADTNPETTLTAAIAEGGYGYSITGTNPAVRHYTVKYVSYGATPGIVVTPTNGG